MKTPFVTKEQLQTICAEYPTPFHLYDEAGIRANARRLRAAFAWNKGYREYFAVKATPNPQILKILKEEGCGTDCSSLTELMMSDRCGFAGSEIMFSSNDTPPEEYVLAHKLGATINLDDITHIDFLKSTIGCILLLFRVFPYFCTPAARLNWQSRRRASRSWTTPARPSSA